MSNKKYSVTIGLDMPTDKLKKSSRNAMSVFDRMVKQQLESVKSLIAADRARGASHERLMRQMTQSEQAIARLAKQESDTRIREGRRAAREIERSLNQVRATSEHTAKDSGSSFSTFLGASFFGNLAANAVSAFFSKAKDFIPESTKLAAETQNALKGLTSVSFFRGVDQAEAEAAVKNLRFVRGGIISVGDASTSVKNLLSTGFGLKESTDLMERFSDASAFGKQSALEYGDAIRSATEGVKNQNSILVDNVGITKNLSVILKERGFVLQDLSDKVKGVAAREALYQGLMAESMAQVGDADKLMQGYTGTIAAQDTAYQNLQRAIGDIIITNPALIESNQIVTEQIDDTTRAIKNQGSESGIMADKIISAWARVKAETLPFMAVIKNLGHAVLQGILVVVTAVVGTVLKTLELLIQSVASTVEQAVNLAISGVNLALAAARQVPGGSMVVPGDIAPFKGAPVQLGSATMFDNMLKGVSKFSELLGRANKSMQEWADADSRIDQAIALRDYQRRFSSELVRSIDKSANEARLAESRALAENFGTATDRAASGTAKAERAARDREIVSAMKSKIDDLAAEFMENFGRALPVRFGQTGLHTKLNYDHRAAADISLDARTKEGQFVLEWLRDNGINARASLGREVSRATGKLISTGTHIHAGELSGAMGRSLRMREGLLTPQALQEALENQSNPFTDLTPPQILQMIATTQRGAQPKSRVPLTLDTPEGASMMQLPIEVERQWDLYYKDAGNREKALRDRRLDYAAEIEVAQRDMLTNIGHLEEDLDRVRAQNADAEFVRNRRSLSAQSEEVDLIQQIARAQDDLANGPLNASLRIQLALIEDISQFRRRDEEAIKSQNRSMLELTDAEIFHGEQARANVLDHLSRARTQTEIFSDAIISSYEAINDVVFRGVQKITGGISILDNLIAGLITRITNRLFQKLLDVLIPGGSSSQGQQSGGGVFGGLLGGGGSGGGILGSLTGGFAGGPGAGGLLSRLAGGGIAAPPSLSATGGSFGNPLLAALLNGGGTTGNAANASGGLLSSLGITAGMAPLLGLGLGVGIGGALGGPTATGSALGMVGGGLLGGSLGAAAFFALGGTTAGGTAMAALLPLLANPLFAVAGGAILAAAIIIKKNKERQAAERQRTQFAGTALEQVYQLLWATQRGEFNSASARSKYEEIHQAYLQQANSIKDSKTRNHAILWWGDVDRDVWPKIEAAAKDAQKRQNDLKRMSPVFAHGGINQMNQLIRVSRGEGVRGPGSNMVNVVPGQFQGREDTEFMFAPRGTEIIPRSRMRNAGGFQTGGTVGGDSGGSFAPNINIEVYIDKDGMGQAVISSPQFKNAVVRNVKIARLEKKI